MAAPSLYIAKNWARMLDFSTEDGPKTDTFIIKGAGATPLVAANKGVVTISCGLKAEDKNIFNKPEKFAHLLQGRSAYVFLPTEKPTEIVIYQKIRIDDETSADFCRFADAVQEVINATLLTHQILGGAKPPGIPATHMYQ